MAGDIAGHFAATRGMTDVDDTVHTELFDERREVVSVGVHVIAAPGLARSTVAATIMGDAAVSVRSQKEHLILPGVRG